MKSKKSKKSILIIGLGKFGRYLALKMQELGNQVMVVDKEEAESQKLATKIDDIFIGDCTNEEVLKSLGITDFDICLKKIGADEIIYPEKELAEKLSLKYHTGYSMKSYLELNQDYSIIEMDVPKHWIGNSLTELNLRRKLGLNIIAIKNSGSVNVVPEPEEHFRENDVIVVVGRRSTIIEYIQE